MRRLFIFTNVIGVFIFDEHYKIIDSVLFRDKSDYLKKEGIISKLKDRYKNAIYPDDKKLYMILEEFKAPKYLDSFYDINLKLTKDSIRGSVSDNQLIIQSISSIEELDSVFNLLVKRAREWYSYYNPEASNKITDNEKFIILLSSDQIKKDDDSIGSDLDKKDIEPVIMLAKKINELSFIRQKEEEYLKHVMKRHCPNVLELAGCTIGAKLIQKAGSLKKLSLFPASTIQLLGAEKALFRHLKNKRNLSPKFGFIHEHPFVLKADKRIKGKVARILADKISIASKVDYFKGDFIGEKLINELEVKFRKEKEYKN